MHSKQPDLYIAHLDEPITKHKEWIKKFEETGISYKHGQNIWEKL